MKPKILTACLLLLGLFLLTNGAPGWESKDLQPARKPDRADRLTVRTANPPIYYRDKAVVLLYHDITPRECGTAISPQRFASHLDMLEESGFSIISLADITAFLQGNQELPANAVAITLDDGCESVYQTVYPYLAKRNWPFAIFVCLSDLGQVRPNGLKRLSWPQLKELSQKGVLVGSHTYQGHSSWMDKKGNTKYWLTNLLPGESLAEYELRVTQDLLRSRKLLEKKLGRPLEHFAPPFGAIDPLSTRLAQQAGFNYVWSTDHLPVERHSPPEHLGRVSVGQQGVSPEQLKERILFVASRRSPQAK